MNHKTVGYFYNYFISPFRRCVSRSSGTLGNPAMAKHRLSRRTLSKLFVCPFLPRTPPSEITELPRSPEDFLNVLFSGEHAFSGRIKKKSFSLFAETFCSEKKRENE
ncbi:hypothetical protein CEXT_262471 [Caerostris extrusa]|uniref:Uncharacterized protein n=1 Tax=Caerostris extrusa TaxID=172846 RepID=A0AAV4R454_CAEEX|nr:hypothetical protein CEXT_262471 [Caerostris extrusa]